MKVKEFGDEVYDIITAYNWGILTMDEFNKFYLELLNNERSEYGLDALDKLEGHTYERIKEQLKNRWWFDADNK